MRYITIDCTGIADKHNFHTAIARVLEFPGWYGNNLDALHDCLTEISVHTQINFRNWKLLEDTLGKYAAAIRRAMIHAADENFCIHVFFD